MVQFKPIISIIVVVLGVILSGCTDGQDITPIFKALPEVQQFLEEHPNAKITVTYWSKDEVTKSIQEISQQCSKSITPAAMYKAMISEGNLQIVSWINAENKIVICSITYGSGNSQVKTPTPVQTSALITPQSSIVVSQAESGIVKLVHRGGDGITLSEVKIIITQGSASAIYATAGQSTDKFIVGDTLSITPASISLNGRALTTGKISIERSGDISGALTITLIYLPNGKEFAKISFIGAFFSSKVPQASIVISSTSASVDVITISHRGGDSIDLNKLKAIIEQGSKHSLISNVIL